MAEYCAVRSQSLDVTERGAGGFGSTGGFKVIGELHEGKPAASA